MRLNLTMAGERTTAGRSLRRIGREVAAIHADLMVLTLLLKQIQTEVCMIKHLAIGITPCAAPTNCGVRLTAAPVPPG